jgi:transposase
MSLKLEFVEWIKRFKKQGYEALEEQSRRPKSAPLSTAEEQVTQRI